MDSLRICSATRIVKFATFVVCALVLTNATPIRSVDASRTTSNVETVALCKLLSNPSLYEQKEVRVKAVYRVGYEWQELYCLSCWDAKKMIWLEFGSDFESATGKAIRRRIEKSEGTYSVTLIGKLSASKGRYGHMGAYRFQFTASRAEQADQVFKDGRSPTLVPKEKLAGICIQ